MIALPARTSLLLALLAAATPLSAQQAAPDTAALRAELDQARAAMRELQGRIDRIEAQLPPAAANQPGASPVPTPPVIVAAGPAPHGATGSPGPGWELAPPGPPDRPTNGSVGGDAATVALVATTGGGRASFSLSHAMQSGGPRTDDMIHFNDQRLELTLSAPLSKSGDTTLATLDGLTSGAKFELGWTIFNGVMPRQSFDDASPEVLSARELCRAANPAYQSGCTRIDDAFKARFMTEDQRQSYASRFARQSIQRSWALGLHGALGYDQFAYFTGVDLAKTTVDRVSWDVGATLTLFPRLSPASTSALIFGADYQRAFQAARTQTACPITVVPAVVRCVTGALAPPNLEEKVILSGEYRQLIRLSPTGIVRSLGIAPRFEFDALSNDYSIDVPIYFVPNDKGRLIGGIRIGYTSREDEIIAGLFIGTTFGIFE